MLLKIDKEIYNNLKNLEEFLKNLDKFWKPGENLIKTAVNPVLSLFKNFNLLVAFSSAFFSN